MLLLRGTKYEIPSGASYVCYSTINDSVNHLLNFTGHVRYFLWNCTQADATEYLLRIIQYCPRWWLGAVRRHAITWNNVESNICCHMASLGQNELMICKLKVWVPNIWPDMECNHIVWHKGHRESGATMFATTSYMFANIYIANDEELIKQTFIRHSRSLKSRLWNSSNILCYKWNLLSCKYFTYIIGIKCVFDRVIVRQCTVVGVTRRTHVAHTPNIQWKLSSMLYFAIGCSS